MTLPTDLPDATFCAREALAMLRRAEGADDGAWMAACSTAASAWAALGQLVATIEAAPRG